MNAYLVTVGAIVAVLSMAANANAEFFEIEALIGPAPIYSGTPVVVDFDLGQEFSEIRNVLLMLEATTTSLTYQSCGWWSHPEPCELVVRNPGFFVRLEDPTGYSTYALVEGFRPDFPRKQSGVFSRNFLDFSFEHMHDGKGTLTVYWNRVAFFPEQNVHDFTLPIGEIVNAKLIVEGTSVPEPSHTVQLMLGVLALSVGNRERVRNRRAA